MRAMDDAPIALAGQALGDEVLRGRTYALLGNLLAGPPEPVLLDLLRGIAADTDAESGLARAFADLRAAAKAAGSQVLLAQEYHVLFIGLGRGELLPYASWYLTGYLMEAPLARLRADLARLGFERQDAVREPEDHAAALCEVMALLAGGGEEPAVPFAEQQSFFRSHLEGWLPAFFKDLEGAGSARFYRAVGGLGGRFMDFEQGYFSMRV
jgi:TorA maturation chaperone TorD